MNNWIQNHRAACRGQESPGWQSQSGKKSLPGYMFLGAAGGGVLGACYNLSASQPELIKNAGLGAFCGGIFMGLLWVVDATMASAQLEERNWNIACEPVGGDCPGIGIAMQIVW